MTFAIPVVFLALSVYVFALCIASMNEDRTQKVADAPMRSAIAAEQEKQPNQPSDVQDKPNNVSDSISWTGIASAIVMLFAGVGIVGYCNGWEAPGWTAYFSAAVVFSTLAQATIGKWQRDTMERQIGLAGLQLEQATAAADAAKKSAAVAEQALYIADRAYLNVIKTEWGMRFEPMSTLIARFHIQNTGRTLATILTTGAELHLRGRVFQDRGAIVYDPGAIGELTSDDTLFATVNFQRSVDEILHADIMHGGIKLLIRITVDYEDAFGHKWKQKFWRVFLPNDPAGNEFGRHGDA